MYKQYKEGKVDTIVKAEWLKENLNTENIRVIDGTFHMENSGRNAKEEFDSQHIPGAVFFDINECADLSSEFKLPHMLPDIDVFEEYVGTRGINNSSHVIVYDNNPNVPVFSAQRVWWTFRCLGYDRVSILEGGLPSWQAAGGVVTSDASQPKREVFKATLRPQLVKSYDQVLANVKSGEFVLVDARPPGRFLGTSPEPIPDVKPGHIPNAVNLPFGKLMDMEKRSYKSAQELAKVFEEHKVDLSKPIIFTCGSGLQASNLVLASTLCGKQDAALFDGSWVEWFRRAPGSLKECVPQDQ